MTSPKRRTIISLVFTCLCISKALLIILGFALFLPLVSEVHLDLKKNTHVCESVQRSAKTTKTKIGKGKIIIIAIPYFSCLILVIPLFCKVKLQSKVS